jgi:hypothetical protein
MNRKQTLLMGAAALVLVGAGLFLSMHRSNRQADLGNDPVFADLEAALGDVEEIRLSRGDGSRTTLRRGADAWTVVERQYPADAVRVRDLARSLAKLRVVEGKTDVPANYPKLGVENPDTPTALSTLVEVVAGRKTWTLIVGKPSEGRAVYVRRQGEGRSLLAAPMVAVDPDQKRWLNREIIDMAGASVHEISVKAGQSPSYLLTRAARGAPDLALSPVPRGRTPAGPMELAEAAESLASFNFDDVRALPDPAPVFSDSVTFRTFDGQVFEFAGRRDGAKAWLTVKAHRDPAMAAKFAPPPAPATPAAAPADKPAGKPVDAPAENPAPPDRSVERVAGRAGGMEYEIPLYKYETLFRPLEDLLERK